MQKKLGWKWNAYANEWLQVDYAVPCEEHYNGEVMQ